VKLQQHHRQNVKFRKVKLVCFLPHKYHGITNPLVRFTFVMNSAVPKPLMFDILMNDDPLGSNYFVGINLPSVKLMQTLDCMVNR
jgi:hypothetical protein